MFTDFILWLSSFFQASFTPLPYIGALFGWIFTIVGCVWFVYWCMVIKKWGNW